MPQESHWPRVENRCGDIHWHCSHHFDIRLLEPIPTAFYERITGNLSDASRLRGICVRSHLCCLHILARSIPIRSRARSRSRARLPESEGDAL
eukprot:3124357-Prymnesium_polylepis.1